MPVSVPERELTYSTAHQWIFNRPIATDAKLLRAFGHYREGRYADYAGLVSYAVLSYYKVIEGRRNDDDAKVKAWITDTYPIVDATHASDPNLAAFRSAIGIRFGPNTAMGTDLNARRDAVGRRPSCRRP